MLRNKYSWEDDESSSSRPKRKIWKWLIIVPLVLAMLAAVVAWLVGMMLWSEFTHTAEQFDLEKMAQMESASFIFDRNGEFMGKIFIQNRDPVSYDKISASLVQAIVSAEDQRFWSHGGVDYYGIARAAGANWFAGKIRQGASTVTQQLARNSFDLKERTYRRKLLEMALAHRIEKKFSKEKIMEMYLNRVYFGGGFYGAESAARGYFGVAAAELTPAQAAVLAGLVKSPTSLSPWSNPDGAKVNRDYVLRQMKDMGFLSSAEYKEAVEEPVLVRQRAEPLKLSYAMDFVRQQVIASLGYDKAMNGGFRIFTTLDNVMQREAEKALRRKLDEIERRSGYANQTYEAFQKDYAANPPKPGDSNTRQPEYLQGAVLSLDNATGGVLVMIGGRDFRHSEYNRSVQGRRPVGTAFAPLVYAAAFEKGQYPGEVVQDWALDNRLVGIGGGAGILGEWGVERAENEYEGEVTAREALVQGKNAAVVRVGFQTGLTALGKLAKDAGIDSALRPYANSYLGTSEMTLEEMTLAYTMFPGGGSRPSQTHIIEKIKDTDGTVVYQRENKRTNVISDSSAWQVHSILTDALTRGTGEKAMTDYGLAVAGAAGKTGTAYNFTDAWFLGYDQAITTGVWVGFDQPRQIFRGAFGKDLALPVWVDVMNASRKDFPSSPMKPPVTVETVRVCRISGELATEKCVEKTRLPGGEELVESTAYDEYVQIGHAPKVQCSVHAGGLRSFVKEFSEEEWPRAAAAVDLSKVRPIDISTAPVVGGDPYNSVSPATMNTFDGDVPVAEAVAVNLAAMPAAKGDDAKLNVAEAVQPEVRKPEAVGVDATISGELPKMNFAPPEPIKF